MQKTNFKEMVKSFSCDTCGATSIEYAMIAAGISIVIIGGVALIGGNLTTLFATVDAMF